jgi:hypothetical protein
MYLVEEDVARGAVGLVALLDLDLQPSGEHLNRLLRLHLPQPAFGRASLKLQNEANGARSVDRFSWGGVWMTGSFNS